MLYDFKSYRTLFLMREIVLLVHDMRSCHNVGSLLRTAEGFGIQKIYFSGYTPYPAMDNDVRLPHISQKLTQQIHKTALGAESLVDWEYREDVSSTITELRQDGYAIVALEQNEHAIMLQDFQPPSKLVLLLGREVEGIAPELLNLVDTILEIPMLGHKESFNVVNASAVAMYQLRFAK